MREIEINRKTLESLIPINKKVLFACIGTDRSTGDSLGPLVGTMLYKKGYTVIGTLHNPLHALNLHETIERIEREYPNHLVVAVDACLGKSERVGKITVTSEPIKPGSAVGKELPLIGDIGIKGIINVKGFMEHAVLQSTRLSKVMDMAEEIAQICDVAMKNRTNGKNALLEQDA
ncbi:spore protease YyaC [Sporosarcina highlanderae]|uniref:Spore protease YyaC n=1 Tax=Sporosarcina highlanderae TaxID=3035916 RepID=A0ABT8JWB7_9BACL|nr:spore protease YyaC [Sporosarcina highlanderae]MDN4609157.1 spore protease YyaC [Sporosarcina highlanderae]